MMISLVPHQRIDLDIPRLEAHLGTSQWWMGCGFAYLNADSLGSIAPPKHFFYL